MFDLSEPFLLRLLEGMYLSGEKIDAQPEVYGVFNQPLESNVIKELYSSIEMSGLKDYPVPSGTEEQSWERMFFRAIFPVSWNIAYSIGLKPHKGYDVNEMSLGSPKLSRNLDEAIGWMRHSNSQLEKLIYWALHAEATDSCWPDFLQNDFENIIDAYSSKVNFSIKGSVKRTKSNVIYVWKALGRDSSDGRSLCKIGITNTAGGEERLLRVAKSAGFTAELLVFTMVGDALAPRIERELLKLGERPKAGSLTVDGGSEFRYLSDREIKSIPRRIFEFQHS